MGENLGLSEEHELNLSYKELIFLISILDAEDKKDLVKEFKSTFRQLVDEGAISRSWYYDLLGGYAPSDELILTACSANPKIEKWILMRALDKAHGVIQIAKTHGLSLE